MKLTVTAPRPSVAGFSLVEVILALGIFAFSILTIIGLMGSSLNLTRDNEERIQAANIATVLLARYQELLAAEKRGEAPDWGDLELPKDPPAASGNPQFSAVEFVDNFGNRTSGSGQPAFGISHIISKSPVVSESPVELVNCTLQLQWPVTAAQNDQPVNTYTATTAFVLSP